MNFRHLTGFLRNHGRISKGTLKRSSSTNSCKINPCSEVVVTLDPSKFAEKKQRRFHIGNLKTFRPHVVLHNQSSPVGSRYLSFNRTGDLFSPYPPGTAAFLYYCMSPEKPRISGELRLRVASSDDYASFESGSDLLRLDGRPWSHSLRDVSKYYTSLYEKLKEDGLVSHDLDAVLSTLPRVFKNHAIYTLNDTFVVDFSHNNAHFAIITEQGVESIRFTRAFEERRLSITTLPYTGRALARFERSTLPDHKGTRTVVLRFLEIITSVKCLIPLYDDYIVAPKEGELHRRSRKAIDKFNPPAWSVNIDKSASLRGLQLLWDT